MSEVRCTAFGGTDLADGRRLRHGQTATDVDLTDPDNRAKIDAGLLLPLAEEPEGETVEEILGWVGDDREKAEQALSAELARPRQRSTLIDRLEELVGGNDGTEEGDD